MSYEELREGQNPPHTFIIKVKFFNGVNYAPRDVLRRWAGENYTPVFYDDYSKPYLYLYRGKYVYDHWEITDNGDGTETVAATLLREKEK